MMIRQIDYSHKFSKKLNKCPVEIQKAFRNRLALFVENEYYPFLHNHALKGDYLGYRSIDITGDWRALFRELDDGIIFFDSIGTHSELYK